MDKDMSPSVDVTREVPDKSGSSDDACDIEGNEGSPKSDKNINAEKERSPKNIKNKTAQEENSTKISKTGAMKRILLRIMEVVRMKKRMSPRPVTETVMRERRVLRSPMKIRVTKRKPSQKGTGTVRAKRRFLRKWVRKIAGHQLIGAKIQAMRTENGRVTSDERTDAPGGKIERNSHQV